MGLAQGSVHMEGGKPTAHRVRGEERAANGCEVLFWGILFDGNMWN